MKTKVMYEGIDSWNRAVFRELREKVGDTKPKRRFGFINMTFPYGEIESEVLAKVFTTDLVYFGREFDCDPSGTPCDVEVVRQDDVPKELW